MPIKGPSTPPDFARLNRERDAGPKPSEPDSGDQEGAPAIWPSAGAPSLGASSCAGPDVSAPIGRANSGAALADVAISLTKNVSAQCGQRSSRVASASE